MDIFILAFRELCPKIGAIDVKQATRTSTSRNASSVSVDIVKDIVYYPTNSPNRLYKSCIKDRMLFKIQSPQMMSDKNTQIIFGTNVSVCS
jgi:hypothetical protein